MEIAKLKKAVVRGLPLQFLIVWLHRKRVGRRWGVRELQVAMTNFWMISSQNG